MRDAAAAAAMSDPDRNQWFRRRWVELPEAGAVLQVTRTVPADDELALTGLALLQEWRRVRRSPHEVQS